MEKNYCVFKYEKDDTPGFRDTCIDKIECFADLGEANKLCAELNADFEGVTDHEGYGAGPGQIITYYYVEDITKTK